MVLNYEILYVTVWLRAKKEISRHKNMWVLFRFRCRFSLTAGFSLLARLLGRFLLKPIQSFDNG